MPKALPGSSSDDAALQFAYEGALVLLTCNRPQFLGRAIQSIIQQSFENWELIVVHDGPNQQTAAAMQMWVERDPRIRYFHRDRAGERDVALAIVRCRAQSDIKAVVHDGARRRSLMGESRRPAALAHERRSGRSASTP